MRRILPIIALVGCPSPSSVPGPASEPEREHYVLGSRQWIARPLLVFGPHPSDPRLREQLGRLDRNAAGLAERDMDDVRVVGGAGTANGTPMVEADVEALRIRFRIAEDDFAVILVGKDGGEKVRATQPIALSQIFATIDAMPMRRREMEEES